eukprot:m.266165 g.266165  ORF g.266165 m.266165 type:complete len:291 (-) comp30156_c0_seq1:77-949(-)
MSVHATPSDFWKPVWEGIETGQQALFATLANKQASLAMEMSSLSDAAARINTMLGGLEKSIAAGKLEIEIGNWNPLPSWNLPTKWPPNKKESPSDEDLQKWLSHLKLLKKDTATHLHSLVKDAQLCGIAILSLQATVLFEAAKEVMQEDDRPDITQRLATLSDTLKTLQKEASDTQEKQEQLNIVTRVQFCTNNLQLLEVDLRKRIADLESLRRKGAGGFLVGVALHVIGWNKTWAPFLKAGSYVITATCAATSAYAHYKLSDYKVHEAQRLALTVSFDQLYKLLKASGA